MGGPGRGASGFSTTVSELLAAHDRQISQVDVVAVSVGPGSFTGLRVGVVAAKTLAYATGCKLVGINTLAAIAANTMASESHKTVYSVVDAQRGQLFVARFHADQRWAPTMEGDVKIVDRSELAQIAQGHPVVGPGLQKMEDELDALTTVDRRFWSCSSECIARAALPRIEADSFDDLWSLKPMYYRASSAEEKKKSNQASRV